MTVDASLPLVVGMATMPTRAQSLPLALNSLLPQVDRLYLYLDGHTEIPAIARENSKITLLSSHMTPNLHGAGKFLGLLHEAEPCLFAGADDDIVYPSDYLHRMREELLRCESPVAVGFHGVVLHQTMESYRRDRQVFAFGDALEAGCAVDVLGSGTILFNTAQLRFDVRAWPEINMTDLQLALEARWAGVRLRCLPRSACYLQPTAVQQEDSIYAGLLKDESRQTRVAQQLIAMKRRDPS